MSFILTSRTRDRQPQGEARLNKTFPSASKIVAAIPLGFSNRDLVSGRSADQGANVNVSGARGLASRDTGNASTAKLSGGLPIGGSKLLTVSWWMNWEVELSNQAATVGIGLTDGSQRGFWFEIDSSTTMAVAGYGPEGYPAGFWKGVWQKSDANFTSNVGKWRHYMLSFDRNSATCCGSRLWIDGVQMPDPSSQGNNAPGDWSTTANLYVSGPPGTPTKTSQTQNIVVRSGYYGTTADARFEYQNPWQLFSKKRTPVFYSIAGVSPGGSSTANRIMLLRRPGLSRIWR